MKGNKTMPRVPGLIRDSLQPYAEIFEDIVLPMIKQTPCGYIDEVLAKTLRREIAEYENRKGQPLHCVLLYYGLILCCTYASQDIMAIKNVPRKTKQINFINKARLLICLAYQQETFHLAPFTI